MDKGEEMERGVKEDPALLLYTTGVDQSAVHREEAQRRVSLGKEALAILHWRRVCALAAILSCGV